MLVYLAWGCMYHISDVKQAVDLEWMGLTGGARRFLWSLMERL